MNFLVFTSFSCLIFRNAICVPKLCPKYQISKCTYPLMSNKRYSLVKCLKQSNTFIKYVLHAYYMHL